MTPSLRRNLVFAYGAVAYAIFVATFLYAIGFIANVGVPKSIDSGAEGPLGEALLVNAALLGVFALQHTGMARAGFKRWWTRLVPQPIERSTYVLLTCAAFALLFWQWRPLPGVVWNVESPRGAALLHGLHVAGWAIMFTATLMINHFELFGLRQVWLHLRSRPHADLGFRTVGFYKLVRHPIQLGFLIAFWATPHMTFGRLLFAAGCTAYILVALRFFEEPDLVRAFGQQYRRYREQVPMFVPVRRSRDG